MVGPVRGVVAVAALLALAGGCARSNDPEQTTIRAHAHLPAGGGPITGTFSASGAVDDSGTLLDTFKVLPKSHEGDDRARVERMLRGRKGTIRIQFVITVMESGKALGSGHIESATRDYTRLRGLAGSYVGHVDFLPHGAEDISDTMTFPIVTD